jgi:hypothetical protein
MQRKALDLYACLKCGSAFRLASATSEDPATGEVIEGSR